MPIALKTNKPIFLSQDHLHKEKQTGDTNTSKSSSHQRKRIQEMNIISSIALSILLLLGYSANIVDGNNTLPDQDLSASTSVDGVVRAEAPCSQQDVSCWCRKATDYTNDVRRREGVKTMLKVGPEAQLLNAVNYAKELAENNKFEHQNLADATREVGCQRWIAGENIAMSSGGGDIARVCVDMWIGSQGHFENLIRERFEEVVVGVHIDETGMSYCVQTFSVTSTRGTFGLATDKGCEQVGGSGSSPIMEDENDEPDEEPQVQPATPVSEPDSEETSMSEDVQSSGDMADSEEVPDSEELSHDPGNRSCRCLQAGRRCWTKLSQKTGDKCKTRTSARYQPATCREQCCNYCEQRPRSPRCTNRTVRMICRLM